MSLLAAAAILSWKGTFCVLSRAGGSVCRDTSGALVNVEGAGDRRPFVWRGEDGRIRLGAIPKDATEVQLEAVPAGSLAFTIVAPDREHARAKFAVTIATVQDTWHLDTGSGKLAVEIPAAARYDVSVELAEYEPIRRQHVTITKGRATDLGRLPLRRFPAVAGTVVKRGDGSPLAGATVTDANGELLAKTDAAGAFRFPCRDRAPKTLIAAYPGFASHTVSLGRIAIDRDLAPIRLGDGATLTVRIHARVHPKTARLVRPEEGGESVVVVAEKVIDAEQVVFEGVEHGDYAVVLSGSEPLEKIVVPVTINGPREITAEIDPVEVRLAVFRGDRMEPNAAIDVHTQNGVYRATVNTGASGEYNGMLWQRGAFGASVSVNGRKFRSVHRVDTAADGEWNIVVPDRRVWGTLTDKETGEPVTGATVEMHFSGDEIGLQNSIAVDEEGRFAIDNARAGRYELSVEAAGYAAPEPAAFTVDESTTERRIDFALVPEAMQPVRLIDAATGAALAGAMVIEVQPNGDLGRIVDADATGTARVGIAPKERKTVYILPPSGSLAIAHLARNRDGSPLRVDVPPPASTIRFRTLLANGAPLANCEVMMRYNGDIVPPQLLQFLHDIRRTPPVSGRDGELELTDMPAGLYEFWPYRGSRRSAASTPAPVRAAIEPGTSTIELRFAP